MERVKILTDNASELVRVKWDGERFILLQQDRLGLHPPYVIILNPREMLDLIKFASKLGGD